MAKQTREVLIDDLTGAEIPEGQGGTVTLMVNDKSTQLDLSLDNLTKLEQTLAPYFNARGESLAPTPRPSSRRTTQLPTQGRSASSRAALGEIRKWAKKNGYAVSERGRIPFAVMDAYTRSHMLTGAGAGNG